MFRIPLTRSLFQGFISTYQSANYPTISKPYVYVDDLGNVKLLANMIDGPLQSDGDYFAVAVANDGFIEYLAMQET